jgi:WD40-like Beta Propeller Repeat
MVGEIGMARALFRQLHIFAAVVVIAACTQTPRAQQSASEAGLPTENLCIGDVHEDEIDLLNRGHGVGVLSKRAPAALNTARFATASRTAAAGPTDRGICVVDFSTQRSMCFQGIAAEDYAISPDGQWLAYNGVDRASGGKGMFALNVATGTRQRLSDGGRKPSWSPDGRRLVYQEGSEIRVIDRAGANGRIVATGTNPSWSPGGVIVYVSASETFQLISPDGEAKGTLGSARDFLGPLQWSPDGRYLLGAKVGWSTAPLVDCLHDRISMVVIGVAGSERTEFNQYCGPGAWRFTWIAVPDICSAQRTR